MSALFPFESEKAVYSLKLILSHVKDNKCDFHKIFKILYFAERDHLTTYGKPITGDIYIAMRNGPVPSTIYDILKYLKGGSIFNSDINFSKHFRIVDNHMVELMDKEINEDVFSESEIESLFQSIEQNKFLSFFELTEKSHDAAWNRANKDDVMSVLDIAKAGGADAHMLNYISAKIQNNQTPVQ